MSASHVANLGKAFQAMQTKVGQYIYVPIPVRYIHFLLTLVYRLVCICDVCVHKSCLRGQKPQTVLTKTWGGGGGGGGVPASLSDLSYQLK